MATRRLDAPRVRLRDRAVLVLERVRELTPVQQTAADLPIEGRHLSELRDRVGVHWNAGEIMARPRVISR
jgi:hypothetical protein